MEAYKNSTIQWLGNIPVDWSITKIRKYCNINPSNVDKKTEENEIDVELCNYTDVYYNRFIDTSIDFMKATATESEIEKFQLYVDDVIVTKDSEDPHDIAVPAIIKNTKKNLLCGYHLSIVKCRHSINGPYLFWCFYDLSIASQFHREATGITRWAIGNRHIKNGIIPLPPLPEQKLIASYLDKTTETIDNAIAVKMKQLVKLEELKKSVIYQAVTKGLDDSVELKDSGVEWIGKIPKHWKLTKLKNHCEVIPSSVDKKTEEHEIEVELCNYTDVYYNRYIRSNLNFMIATASESEINKFQLRENDIIITKDSEDPNDIAVPAIVKDTKEKLLCGYHLSIIRCDNKLIGSYLFWCIYDSSIVTQFHREATGITRWAIANKHVKNGIIPLPPISEQNMIYNFIQKKIDELDITVNKIESQIQKLEDYKKSLIHECVTGKRRITEKDIREDI